MAQLGPNVIQNAEGQGIFATSLTSDVYAPETAVMAGDFAQSAPIEKGTVLGRITATGLVAPYDNAASDGTETAIGILGTTILEDDLFITDINGGITAYDVPVTVYTAGEFIESELIGLDASAITDLGATSNNGVLSF